MTENEAKEILLQIAYDGEYPTGTSEAFSMAIQALEEIQQYRAIGTVERLLQLQHDYWYLNEMCKEYSAIGTVENIRFLVENIGSIKLLKEYNAIGTIEEFKALKEKNEPKEMDRYYCPICRHYFEDTDAYNYCPVCGQKMKPIWQ